MGTSSSIFSRERRSEQVELAAEGAPYSRTLSRGTRMNWYVGGKYIPPADGSLTLSLSQSSCKGGRVSVWAWGDHRAGNSRQGRPHGGKGALRAWFREPSAGVSSRKEEIEVRAEKRCSSSGHGQAVHRPTLSVQVHCDRGRDVTVLEAVRGDP